MAKGLWRVVAGIALGAAIGIGGYTFIYARGASYLTNDPASCANCHVMRDQYSGWIAGPHRSVATCNDCHTPHDFVGKWMTKASNGWHHSVAFTTGRFHEPILIGSRNRAITESACRSCHSDLVHQLDQGGASVRGPIECLRCHSEVGHL